MPPDVPVKPPLHGPILAAAALCASALARVASPFAKPGLCCRLCASAAWASAQSSGRSGAGFRLRVLIYSHDSFGLGHLRRCRTIAAALARAYPGLSAVIVSGSPIIGSFAFPERVDFVRVPGVLKLADGGYTPLTLPIQAAEAFELRGRIIAAAAEGFRPDVAVVDKEPLGLRGELSPALDLLKRMGTRLVLGLRDVLDDAEALNAEWRRKQVGPALATLYDDILIYGCAEIFDPLAGIDLDEGIRAKIRYTGYLRRELPAQSRGVAPYALPAAPYVLVTTGGGGDGEGLIDWVLSAYEQAPDGLPRALLALGPFMPQSTQRAFLSRAERLGAVTAIGFDAEIEHAVAQAAGVIAMGGYNTFCEILSFDRPAVIVPRERPRREQWLRAKRAQDLELVRLLEDPAERGGTRSPQVMAEALRQVVLQPRPSQKLQPGMLDGLDAVVRILGER